MADLDRGLSLSQAHGFPMDKDLLFFFFLSLPSPARSMVPGAEVAPTYLEIMSLILFMTYK